MARKVSRKLELFSLHAHQFEPLSYVDIFRELAQIERQHRIANVSGSIIGFPHIIPIEEGYFVQVVEGDPSAQNLVFDTATGDSRESILDENEVIGQATHLVINPDRRIAAIEYTRRGAKALQLGPAIAGILRNRAEGLSEIHLEFSPKIARDFSEEIAKFDRIRYASIRVTKPNASWTDHYTALSDLMDESDGAKADIDVRAARGSSLKKDSGIIKIIEDISNDEHPYLEESTVTGTREGEAAETTVRSSAHIVHSRAMVDADDTGAAYDNSIRRKLIEFLSPWIR